MPADAGALGLVVGVEVGVQHLDRLTPGEQGLMRAMLAVLVAGALRMMGYRMTMLADNGLGRHPVGVAVALVGGDDAVGAVDHHEGLLMCIDQALQLDVHG